MSLPLEKNKKYTYEDYLTWPDDKRWELINGVPYCMSPSPSFKHQKAAGKFYTILENNLKGKSCIPFIAPLDVVLSKYDTIQPDVFVICNKNKIKKREIQGAPTLIIEVLSPSGITRDKHEKKALYERWGVTEYIIIDPIEKRVERFYIGQDGKYNLPDIFSDGGNMKLLSLDEMEIPLSEVFEEI